MTDPSRLCGGVHWGYLENEEVVIGVLVMSAIVVPPWEVYMDRASNQKGVGIRIVLITPEKLIMEKSLWLGFLATNNEAEYEALLARVALVRQLGGEVVELYFDSGLVVGQVNGDFEHGMKGCRGIILRCKVPGLSLRVLYWSKSLGDRTLM